MSAKDLIVLEFAIGAALLLTAAMLHICVADSIYRNVEATVVVEQHYEKASELEAATSKCMKLLADNGYTLVDIGTTTHGGKPFAVAKGRICKKKDRE